MTGWWVGPHPGMLPVVVWNIARNPKAWDALDGLEPGICLLNEAVVSEGRKGIWSATGTNGGGVAVSI